MPICWQEFGELLEACEVIVEVRWVGDNQTKNGKAQQSDKNDFVHFAADVSILQFESHVSAMF